jgi:hypothetical protein
MSCFHLYQFALKKLSYGFSVCVFPNFQTLRFAEYAALVNKGMTPETQSRYTVIMRLYPPSFSVSELVRVRRYNSSIFRTAVLARHLTASLK